MNTSLLNDTVLWNKTVQLSTPPESETNLLEVLTCALSSWAVLSNCTIVVVILLNWKIKWPEFMRIVLNLSICDFFGGLSTLTFVMLQLLKVEISFIKCGFFLFVIILSQVASLYSMFGMCLHRSLIVRKPDVLNPETHRISRLFAPVVWFVGLIVTTVPFVLWTNYRETSFVCKISFFNTDTKALLVYALLMYFIPELLTNVLYTYAYLRLRSIWGRRIKPSKIAPEQIVSPTRDVLDMMGKVKSDPYPEINVVASTSFANQNKDVMTSKTCSSKRPPIPRRKTDQRELRFQSQRHALLTIGLILMLLNLLTLPIVIAFFLRTLGISVSRDYRYVVFALFVFHSALNPVIHTARTSWLKRAFVDMFKRFRCVVRC